MVIDRTVLAHTITVCQRQGCCNKDVRISQQGYDNLLDVFLLNDLVRQRHPWSAVITGPQ